MRQSAKRSFAVTQTAKPRIKSRGIGRKKQTIKPSTIGLYASAFTFVIALVAIGYRPSESSTAVASVSELSSSVQETSVDEVVATSLAANMAEMTNLPVASNVANLSISLSIKSELAQSDDTAIVKPQIVQPEADRRTIITHTTKSGETVDSVASEYGISKETVKWANDLTSDALEPGKKLRILPVDGVAYTVGSGDTVASIAKKYGANEDRIVAFNNLELTGLERGAQIIIPAGELPEEDRPGYVAPQSSLNQSVTPFYGSFAGGSVGNRYAYGYCTWYAYDRRAQLGRPVGSFWGHAKTWAMHADANGYTVNKEPAPGAVFQTAAGFGGYGHVGIIESVDRTAGTVTYTDMNGVAGWNAVGKATISISQAKAQWVFIH